MYILSTFGSGLWLIPTILILASIYSFYRANKQWKSGSAGWVLKNYEWKWVESDKRVPFWSIGAAIFGAGFFIAFVVTVILMYSDK